jgi:peptide/nickel transport system substrate-binding protein
MTRTMRIATILLVGLALLAGPAAAQNKPAGELTVALPSFATDVIDPVLGGHVVKFYLSLVFDHLVGVTPDGQLSKEGGIADRWEASPDHKRWTFHLRKGVRFHNGDEVTAEDVKFSILRAIGKRSTTGYAGPLRILIQDIETPAPDRVVIVTKEPTLIIPAYLSRGLSTEGMVLPKKYVEAKGDDGFARAAIGSGPYRVVEQVSGSHVKLEAVDSHWRVGVPRYKTIVFKRIPEEATRVAILRRGEADIVELSRDRVKEVERAGFRVVLKKSDAYLDLYWTPPWDNTPIKDKRVREALNLAIDRGEMAATIFGGLAEPCSIPMGFSWAYPAIKFRVPPELVYPFDPVRAKALLAEAGYPNGFPIDMYAYQLPGLAEGRSMTEAIAGYWQKIGVQPKIVPIDYAGFRKKRIDGVTPGAFGFFNLANRDWVGAYAYIEKASSASSPLPTVRDAEIDGMVERILTQTDQEKINALMRNIFLRLRSEHFGIPLVYLHTAYATSKKIGAWNPGQVLYDFNIEGLVASK